MCIYEVLLMWNSISVNEDGIVLLPVSSLKMARAGEVSAAFQSRTVPSAEQDSSRWWAEL